MKNIKLITIYFLIISMLLLNFSCFEGLKNKVFAEDKYVRVEKEDVLFYSSALIATNSELFVLPKGYYLKVISNTDKTLYCEYAESANSYSKLLGYVKIDDVAYRQPVSPTYPPIFLTALTSSPIYAAASKDSKVLLTVFSGQEIVFYGYSKDKNFLFCSIGVEFGYAPKTNFESFDIPVHSEPLPIPSPSPTKVTETPSPTEVVSGAVSKPLQIILIIFIAIPVIIITILLFFSPKNNNKKYL